jgi:hypothetical protein
MHAKLIELTSASTLADPLKEPLVIRTHARQKCQSVYPYKKCRMEKYISGNILCTLSPTTQQDLRTPCQKRKRTLHVCKSSMQKTSLASKYSYIVLHARPHQKSDLHPLYSAPL